ncbi:MAG: DUF2164 domain-containing protein [Gemmatimonadota bacterium]
MPLTLDDERRAQLVSDLQGFYLTDFDEALSAFRAEQLVDFVLDSIGPRVYNQAVQDARAWMLRKLEDLEGDVYVAESG